VFTIQRRVVDDDERDRETKTFCRKPEMVENQMNPSYTCTGTAERAGTAMETLDGSGEGTAAGIRCPANCARRMHERACL